MTITEISDFEKALEGKKIGFFKRSMLRIDELRVKRFRKRYEKAANIILEMQEGFEMSWEKVKPLREELKNPNLSEEERAIKERELERETAKGRKLFARQEKWNNVIGNAIDVTLSSDEMLEKYFENDNPTPNGEQEQPSGVDMGQEPIPGAPVPDESLGEQVVPNEQVDPKNIGQTLFDVPVPNKNQQNDEEKTVPAGPENGIAGDLGQDPIPGAPVPDESLGEQAVPNEQVDPKNVGQTLFDVPFLSQSQQNAEEQPVLVGSESGVVDQNSIPNGSPIAWGQNIQPTLQGIDGKEDISNQDEFDYDKVYEDFLTERLSYAENNNLPLDELGEDKVNEALVAAAENKAYKEKMVYEAIQDYKQELLEKGFEENSADLSYLLGMKRELIQEEINSGKDSDYSKEAREVLEKEEDERLKKLTEDKTSDEVSPLSLDETDNQDLTPEEDKINQLGNPNYGFEKVMLDDGTITYKNNDEIEDAPEDNAPVLPEINVEEAIPAPIIDEYGQVILTHDLDDVEVQTPSTVSKDVQSEKVSDLSEITTEGDELYSIVDANNSDIVDVVNAPDETTDVTTLDNGLRTLGEAVYGESYNEEYENATPEAKKELEEKAKRDLAYRYAVVYGWPIESAKKLITINQYPDVLKRLTDDTDYKWESSYRNGTLEAKIKEFNKRENIAETEDQVKDTVIQELSRRIEENEAKDVERQNRIAELEAELSELKEAILASDLISEAPNVDAPEQEVGPSMRH